MADAPVPPPPPPPLETAAVVEDVAHAPEPAGRDTTVDLLGELADSTSTSHVPATGASSLGARSPPDLLPLDTPSDDGKPVDTIDETAAQPGSAIQVFQMGDSPSRGESIEELDLGDEPTARCGNAEGGADDWYSLDESTANKSLELGNSIDDEMQIADTSAQSASAVKTQVPAWASKLTKKAGKLGSAAKTAIMAEAKLVAADAKDLAMGVREGANITMQDTKSLSKQLQRDAQQLRNDAKKAATTWRGLWRGSRGTGGDATIEESSSVAPAVASSPATGARAAETAESSETTAGGAAGTRTEGALPSREQGDDSDLGERSPSRSGGIGMFKQTWSATAEVSSQMWKDLKEVKDDALTEFRQGVQELKQGVQSLRPNVGQSAGLCRESSRELAEPKAESSAINEADAEQERQTTPAASPTEALDFLLAGGLDAEDAAAESRSATQSDNRSGAEKRYDEQTARVASKVEEVARATAAATTKVWRKTELSIKKGLAAMPVPERGGAAPINSTSLPSSDPDPRHEEGRNLHQLVELPSTRANYVELSAPSDASGVVAGSSEPGVGAAASTEATALSDAGARKADNLGVKATSTGAARRAKKLGGRLARKSREVSGNLFKQARDLGQQAGAVATRQKSGNVGTPNVARAADSGEKDDGIFEIGSDEEEELFAGDGNSGSDMVSGTVSGDEDTASSVAEIPPPCSVSEAPPVANELPSAAAPVGIEPQEVPAANAPQSVQPEPVATSAAAVTPPAAPDSVAAPVAVQSQVVQPPQPVAEPVAQVESPSAAAEAPRPAVPPAPKAPASGAEQMRLKMEARKAKVEVAPAAVEASASSVAGKDQTSDTAQAAAAPSQAAAAAGEDPFADLDLMVATPAAVEVKPSDVNDAVGSTPAVPAQTNTAADSDEEDWFNDLVGDDLAVEPSEPASAPAAAIPAAESGGADAAKLEFLAAAEKELEDLFGDDD